MFNVGDVVEQCIQTKSIPKYARGKVVRVLPAYNPTLSHNAYEVEFLIPVGPTGPNQQFFRLRYENEIVPLHSGQTPTSLPPPPPPRQSVPWPPPQQYATPPVAKGCQHEWEERTLFISTEEFCIKCGDFKPKTKG